MISRMKRIVCDVSRHATQLNPICSESERRHPQAVKLLETDNSFDRKSRKLLKRLDSRSRDLLYQAARFDG